jgi:hypothetical protein
MTLETLERQVLRWNRAAILVPIFFTAWLGFAYVFELCDLETLFFVAAGLYFTTAVVWWWWTMKSIHLLVKVLQGTKQGIVEIAVELKAIRKEIFIDNVSDK